MANSIIARLEHRVYLELKKKKLKNHNPTIISSNCNGAYILHDLGLKFNTPTVNLYFETKDYLKFVSNLDKYLSAELIEIESNYSYPVGQLDDINIYFMHYGSFDEAKLKWNERKKRVNKDNMFLIMSDRNHCTYEDLITFDNLPFKNKIVFTHKPYPEIKSAVYIKGFEEESEVGVLSDWKPTFLKRRYLDDFDYVRFLNNSTKRC
jgi:uncharacterized protein (DUF1919 family)